MSHFLITSAISMGVLLGAYHLLLEKEKMHRFNRFYLIAAIVLSLALPFITIEVYTEIAAEPVPVPTAFPLTPAPVAQAPIIETNCLPYIVWGVYGLITLALAVRFMLNIFRFSNKVRRNEKTRLGKGVVVLINESVLPHTFLHYIFINKAEYENRLIEEELFTHELAHVNQKHTLDILFIEVLKTLLWFNPLLFFYKKAIQLNHEFLADEVVVDNDNVVNYQQLLLQKVHMGNYYPLASSLNFSVTKKRFMMMTKATTKTRALVLKLVSLPVVAGLIALLCIETVAQEMSLTGQQAGKASVPGSPSDDEKRDRYYAGVWVKIIDEPRGVNIDSPYEELTLEQKRDYLPLLKAYEKKAPSAAEFNKWKDNKKYALWLDEGQIDNKALSKISPKDIASYRGSSVFKNARTKQHPQPYQFHLYTHDYYENNLKKIGEKYHGTLYELHVHKDRNKITGNSPIALMHEIEKQDAEAEREKKRSQSTISADHILYADTITYNRASQQDKVYSVEEVKVKPEFPGGMSAFYNFIMKNFRVPEVEEDMQVKIYVSFIIEKDGSMSNIKAIREPGFGTGAEAERVLKLITTKWKPGLIKEKPVRVSYTTPITLNIKA